MESNALCWYEEKGKELAEGVCARVDQIKDRQSYMSERNKLWLCMYGNIHDFGHASLDIDYTDPLDGSLTLNVVQIVIDTLASKIGANEPRPYFLTDEGDWNIQEQAQKLNKFVYGQFTTSKTYKKSAKAFLCANIFGTGALKHYRKDDAIVSDWVVADEIIVDNIEAKYGEPRNLFQTRLINRDTLIAMFPKKEQEIKEIKYEPHDFVGDQTLSNMIEVIEAWHLPSSKDSKDGKHAIIVKDIVLLEESYTRDKFPFSFYTIFDPVMGFYGKGVAELLAPIQLEINKTLKRIAEAIHIASVPRVFIERAAKVKESQLNNDIGGIVEYEGRPPVFDVARAVSPELASHLENLYQKAFEQVGLSQLSAQGKKPAGLNSGKALREYNDIETERFKRIAKAWEEFHLDIADHYIDLAEEISKSKPDYSVLAIDKEGTSKIKWKDIKLKRDAAVMKSYPTSMLPKHPAGRLEFAQELVTAGFIDQQEGLELLEFPDIKSVTNLKTSPFKMAKKIMSHFVEGKYIEPDIYHPNAVIMPYIQNGLLWYETQNLKEERLDLFRQWIDEALLLINPPQEQQTEMEGEIDAIAEDNMQANTDMALASGQTDIPQ